MDKAAYRIIFYISTQPRFPQCPSRCSLNVLITWFTYSAAFMRVGKEERQLVYVKFWKLTKVSGEISAKLKMYVWNIVPYLHPISNARVCSKGKPWQFGASSTAALLRAVAAWISNVPVFHPAPDDCPRKRTQLSAITGIPLHESGAWRHQVAFK
jgi:hypothetical protein